jgi:hypothetical protein
MRMPNYAYMLLAMAFAWIPLVFFGLHPALGGAITRYTPLINSVAMLSTMGTKSQLFPMRRTLASESPAHKIPF